MTSRGSSAQNFAGVTVAARAAQTIKARTVSLSFIVLAISMVMFGFDLHEIDKANGWWTDELFSIWASDPTRSFWDDLILRILPDTNPPLYYSALFFCRIFFSDVRSAIVFLNVSAILICVCTLAVVSYRRGLVGFALVTAAVVLITGPILRYALEGRSYLIAMMLSYVASWLCALEADSAGRNNSLALFVVVGLMASLTHLFASLFCCCLAAGMIALALIRGRRDLLKPAFALSIPGALLSILWAAFALRSVANLNWIDLSSGSLLTSIWEIKQLAFGSRILLATFGVICIMSLVLRDTRRFGILFSATIFLFFAVPLAVSVVHPIITGRYLLIGSPIIVVWSVFFAKAAFGSLAYRSTARPVSIACGSVAMILMVGLDISGFHQALAFTKAKPLWSGAEIVAPLLRACPPHSVYVNGRPANFAFAAHVPEAVFIESRANTLTSTTDPKIVCQVLGWAEHVLQGDNFLRTATDAQLLSYLHIGVAPSEVEILRHSSGFVVIMNRY